MSRLIKADEAKRAFIGNRYGTKAIEYVIDNVPTVEAIPIEWIEKWIAYWERILPGWGAFQVCAAMLKDWEKENDSNDTIRI